MAGRTDLITDARWEDVWTIWYTLVDGAYRTLEQHYDAWRRTGSQALFSDSEAITGYASIANGVDDHRRSSRACEETHPAGSQALRLNLCSDPRIRLADGLAGKVLPMRRVRLTPLSPSRARSWVYPDFNGTLNFKLSELTGIATSAIL